MINILLILIFIINFFLIFMMIFVERKKPNIVVSWFVVLTFLPIIGFLIYFLIGNGLSYKTTTMLKKMRFHQKEYLDFIKEQKKLFTHKLKNDDSKTVDLALFNLNNSNSAYFENNLVDVFTSGKDKIDSLKKDLLKAKHSINILYYIFADDEIGNEIMEILIQKAKKGVKVKLLYDSIGCLKTKKSFFETLKTAGGEVSEFFPPLWGLKFLNLKINYRNHRKIVVIDGKIGYTGGINIRDDHMGKNKRLYPWRDTHIRVVGQAVYSLQISFFNDWRFCKNIQTRLSNLLSEGFFPRIRSSGNVGFQTITSGPDSLNQPIKDAFIKMILMAKKNIYIETPYFIPDEFMIGALTMAYNSGVDIKIIIPSKPDKKFVYSATLSYVKELLPTGIKFYFYNGFIHSKSIIIDDEIVSIGTCNFDNRSFALNFEINAFLYSKEFTALNISYFLKDLENSTVITPVYFRRRPWINKLGQAFFRMFSPLL